MFAVLLFFIVDTYAQTDITTAGGTVINASGEFSYTIGQISISSFEDNNIYVNEGVQQPYCQPSYDTLFANVCQDVVFDEYNFSISASEAHVPGTYTYHQYLTNLGGCDSVITLFLTVNAPSVEEETISACDNYTWHNLTFSQSTDTIIQSTNFLGCDSTSILHLTINNSSVYEFSDQGSYTYEWNGVIYEESGIYQQILMNQYGCDSTVTLNLTIIEKPLPIIVTYDKRVLVVDHFPNGTAERIDYTAYQWYKDDVAIPEAELDQYFEENYPILSGCYYVKVPTDPTMTRWVKSNTICMDNLVGLDDLAEENNGFLVYPNPARAKDQITVTLVGTKTFDMRGLKMNLCDVGGRILQTIDVKQPRFTINLPHSAGYYTLYLYRKDDSIGTKKIIIYE